MAGSYREAGLILAFPDAQEKVAEILDELVTYHLRESKSQIEDASNIRSLRTQLDDALATSASRNVEIIELSKELSEFQRGLGHALGRWERFRNALVEVGGRTNDPIIQDVIRKALEAKP